MERGAEEEPAAVRIDLQRAGVEEVAAQAGEIPPGHEREAGA